MFRLSPPCLFALCSSLLAAPALSCPQSLPPNKGLVLIETGPGTRNHFRQTEDGLLQDRVTKNGATTEQSQSLYSHPLTVVRLTGAGGVLEIVYGNQVEKLNQIDRLGEWHSDVLLKRNGAVLAVGTDKISFLGASTVTIADCTYPTLKVEERMELTGYDPILFEKDYAPDLGLVLQSVQKTIAGATLNEVTFLSIESGP